MAERDQSGKFKKGNRAASGHRNKTAQKRAKLADEFLRQLKQDEFAQVVRTLLDLAQGGNVAAIKEVLDRGLGKPQISETPEEPLKIQVCFPPELENL